MLLRCLSLLKVPEKVLFLDWVPSSLFRSEIIPNVNVKKSPKYRNKTGNKVSPPDGRIKCGILRTVKTTKPMESRKVTGFMHSGI